MTQRLELMASERKCLDCGTPLSAEEPQPVCPRCIFQRFAKTGSTVYPPETAPALTHSEDAGRDFHAEYELLGEIGRGGMGVIYKALQPRLNRVVAIKVIHAPQVVGEAARRRFEAEMQNVAVSDPRQLSVTMAIAVARLYGYEAGKKLAQKYGVPVPPLKK